MKHIVTGIFLLFMASCTPKIVSNDPPLGYSFMPGYLDLDSIQPFKLDDTARVVDSTYEDFQTIPIEGGKLIGINKDTTRLPAGLVISDRKGALYVFYKAGWERQQKELIYSKYLMREYYDKAKSAEVLYQKEIKELNKKAERSWLEKNLGYLGFVAGLATSVLTCYALFGGTNFVK
jgi:hypothetical protein